MINILMHGCNGKMGKVITSIVNERTDCKIVAGIDLNTQNEYFPVFSNMSSCNVEFDVVIDFSTAAAVTPLIDDCVKHNKPLILCTTGLQPEQIAKVREASTSIPIFYSANMSLGINLMIALAKKATEILTDANFDIEIIEKHHNQKIDAPSGTALAIADGINEVLDNEYKYKYDRSPERIKRPKKEIGIHAVRGGTIVGEHSVIFAGQDEIIELKHNALSKEVFGVGAVKAAIFMVNKAAGLYTMEDLINE